MSTLISGENTWALWAITIILAAISVWLEQNYKWANKLSGPVLGLIFALALSNLHVVPYSAPAFDIMQEYLVPIGVVLLLFRADFKTIVKDTGKMFLTFNVSAVGTLLGVALAFFCLKSAIPELDKMSGVMTGSYIGGGVNFFAVAESTHINETLLSAEIVADNFVMSLCFLVMLWIPTSAFGRKHWKHPFQEEVDKKGDTGNAKTLSAAYWGAKEISLIDIAFAIAIAVGIAAAGANLSSAIKAHTTGLVNTIIGNQFVLITVITVVLATIFPKFFSRIRGAQELGTFMMYIFFVAIGYPSDLLEVIKNAPLLFLFCAIIVIVNICFTFGLGKLFKFNSEEMAISVCANIGGPSSGACVAIAKGYDTLVVPGILVGLWGYIIGTPLGLMIAEWFSKLV
jgi:uncharacterized membrane protein